MRAAFPGTEGEWMGALIIAVLLGVSVLVASEVERRRAWHRRRQRAARLGFVRRARRDWDAGL
jgi:hypothetical protein